MKRVIIILFLIFSLGCRSAYKKVETIKAERTREGIYLSKSIIDKELSKSKTKEEVRQSTLKLSEVINVLYLLWGLPEHKIKATKEEVKRWVRRVEQVTIENRKLFEKLLIEKAKSRLSVFSSLKLLVLAVSCIGLVGVCIYVRLQYGRAASFVVGSIGGAILIGYVFIIYKTYLIIGGVVIGALLFIFLIYSLFKEVNFSKSVIESIQRVREYFESNDTKNRKKIDSLLTQHQDSDVRSKIKRVKHLYKIKK